MTKHRGKKSITDKQIHDFFTEHLPYEVNMFRALLAELGRFQPNTVLRNATIEGIATHARNLIEFFKNKPPCDFDPRRFTEKGYVPNGNFIDSKLEAKINQQVSHLTAERTSFAAEKINASAFRRISEAIESEIERFENALSPDYRAKWKVLPTHFKITSVEPSATNVINSTSTASWSATFGIIDLGSK
jgi:hypothetical protein